MKLKYLLSGLSALLVLAACNDVPEPVPSLTLKSRVVEFDSSAGTAQLPVECSIGWSAEVDTACAAWLSAAKSSDALELTVIANEGISDREGSVFITAGPKKAVVTVTQYGILLSATVSKDSLDCIVGGGQFEIEVESSIDWRLDLSENWITADKERGSAGKSTVALTVAPSADFNEREGFAKICYGMKTLASVRLLQDPFVVHTSLEGKNLEAPVEGGVDSVKYKSNYEWTVSSSDTWITVSPSEGVAGELPQTVKLTFAEASALERNGKVVFVSGDVKDTVFVHQSKAAAKPIEMVVDLWNGSKYATAGVFSESIASSASSSYNQGVKTLSLVKYPGYSFEYYSSYSGPLINSTSALITLPAIVAGKTSNAIRATEGFAYIKFPAIEGFTLDKVVVKTPEKASTKNFPSYITSTYGTSNAEAKAAALTDVIDMKRCATVEYNLKNPKAGTAYYLFMEPNGGVSSTTNGFLIACITLTYNPAE